MIGPTVGSGGVQRCIRRRTNRDYSAPEFDANSNIVRGGKSSFTEADGQAGFASTFIESDKVCKRIEINAPESPIQTSFAI